MDWNFVCTTTPCDDVFAGVNWISRESNAQWSACISAVRHQRFQPCPIKKSDAAPVGRLPAPERERRSRTIRSSVFECRRNSKARLNALSAVTGLAQWRVIVEAINCFLHDLPDTDRELVDGLSERLMRVG